MAMTPDSENQSLKSTSKSKEDGYGSLEAMPTKFKDPSTACMYICVVELCERLAFYTFNGTIAFFLERVGFSLVKAGGISACMVTLAFLFTIVASWFADVVLGRFKTILFASVVYIIGSVCAATGTYPGSESIPLFFVGMLGFIPIGTAGIKANLSNLGADQYDITQPGQEAAQERFFSLFYMFINVGALVSYGFMTSFAVNGGFGVPREFGYFTAYTIAAICMAVATGIFLWGSDGYRKVPVQERSAIYSVARCLGDFSKGGEHKATSVCIGFVLLVAAVLISLVQAFCKESGTTSEYLILAGFVFAAGGLFAVVMPCTDTSWIITRHRASLEGHPTEDATPRDESSAPSPEDIKGFLDLLPVLFVGNLAFNALYNCMAYWYQQQACQMDLRLTSHIQLAGSFFNVADCISIIVVTPLAVDFVNPGIARRMGIDFGYSARYSVGMVFGVASVLTAAAMEVIRRNEAVLPIASQCAPKGVNMSAFPSAWIFIPYSLMGIGEIYCNPALMHFAYSRAPPTMRTLAAAISFFIQAISSALFALVLDSVRVWIPNDLNQGHLEYGYFISIAIGLVLYMWFMKLA